jgi:ferredoxin-nitrite reductase
MANKIEALKAAKDGLAVKADIEHFAKIGWEAIDDDDQGVSWCGCEFPMA